MSGINCVVDDSRKKLVYDRSSLPELKKKDFRFNIANNGDTDIATFEMVKNDVTVKKHTSLPFPAGSLKHKGNDVNTVTCTVNLKKLKEINLDDYFAN